MDRYLHPSPQLSSLQGEESSEDDTLSEYQVPLWLHLWFHVFSASLAISSAISDRMETRRLFEQRAAPKMAIGYVDIRRDWYEIPGLDNKFGILS